MAKLNEYDELFYEGNATKPPFNKKRIMTHDEMIAVIQAHKEGNTIQFKSYGEWHDCNGNKPIWNFDRFEYRVKPELKYRPYASAEEFLRAQKEHGLYLRLNDADLHDMYIPTSVNDLGVYFSYSLLSTWGDILDTCTWQDGTPCGVKVED